MVKYETVYDTALEPQEVEAFYLEVMPKYGWSNDSNLSDSGKRRLTFGYDRDGAAIARMGWAIIEIKETSGGHTTVEVKAGDTSIQQAP